MSAFYKPVTALLVLAGFVAIIVALVMPRPEAAWNSGARDALRNKLRYIADELAGMGDQMAERNVDVTDFIPRTPADIPEHQLRGATLLKRHGVRAGWRKARTYETLVFYPIALSPEIAMTTQKSSVVASLIVMVPVGHVDEDTLPLLDGCDNATDDELQSCQLGQIKNRFALHGIEDAACLMSDGSVLFIRVDDLRPAHAKRSPDGTSGRD